MTDRMIAPRCRRSQDGSIRVIRNYTAVSDEPAVYHFGRTTYTVRTFFNSDYQESLVDVVNRLILHECERIFGEKEQEPKQQAV